MISYAAVFFSALIAGTMIGILIGIQITPRLYQPGGPISEFLNDCGEVHAAMIGIIHTATRIRPLQYSEIDGHNTSPALKEDLKNEYHYYKAFFWIPRILILIIGIWKTGIIPPALII